jgi:hypothetical protein
MRCRLHDVQPETYWEIHVRILSNSPCCLNGVEDLMDYTCEN